MLIKDIGNIEIGITYSNPMASNGQTLPRGDHDEYAVHANFTDYLDPKHDEYQNILNELAISDKEPLDQPNFDKQADHVFELMTKVRETADGKGISLVVKGINVDSEGPLAEKLEEKYQIRPIDEGYKSGEAK